MNAVVTPYSSDHIAGLAASLNVQQHSPLQGQELVGLPFHQLLCNGFPWGVAGPVVPAQDSRTVCKQQQLEVASMSEVSAACSAFDEQQELEYYRHPVAS